MTLACSAATERTASGMEVRGCMLAVSPAAAPAQVADELRPTPSREQTAPDRPKTTPLSRANRNGCAGAGRPAFCAPTPARALASWTGRVWRDDHPEPSRQPALRDSIPIALGYFTVSLAFGLYCARMGVPTALAGLISFTNLSSSGQFAGITIIGAQGSYLELAIGVALVNLRYVLMAISLGQRLGPQVGTGRRLLLAAGITDEIYALGMGRRQVGFGDYAASMVLPIIGWTSGTIVGAAAGEVLPARLVSAFGVLLYAMFVAIVVPAAAGSWQVLAVVLGAAGLSSRLLPDQSARSRLADHHRHHRRRGGGRDLAATASAASRNGGGGALNLWGAIAVMAVVTYLLLAPCRWSRCASASPTPGRLTSSTTCPLRC